MLTGPNGLLTQANEAKTKTEESGAKEKVQIAVASSWGENGFDPEKFETEVGRFKGDITSGEEEFPIKVTVDGQNFEVSNEGVVTEKGKNTSKEIIFKNIDTKETNPAGSMPKGAIVIEENGKELNDANEGIAIKDTYNNEWVWIEVPKSIYKNPDYTKEGKPSGETDYDKITKVLKAYADPYTKGSIGQMEDKEYTEWKDTWYDKLGTVYDGENEYSEITYITYQGNFTKAKEYYGTIYKNNIGTEEATSYASGTKYYARITEKLNDSTICGLTYNEYKNTYQTMLKSIYNNGGFWIGRYEAGIEGTTESIEEHPEILNLIRTDSSPRIDISTSPKAISQKDAIPYSYITCREAQKLASQMTPDNSKISSLMFGIQWDLVCKFIEEKEVVKQGEENRANIIDDINHYGTWGNFNDHTFPINTKNAKACSWYDGIWHAISGSKISSYNGGEACILLSTGSSEHGNKLNFYDFAGNAWEFTLPSSRRGSDCTVYGSSDEWGCSVRFEDGRDSPGGISDSFRPALY